MKRKGWLGRKISCSNLTRSSPLTRSALQPPTERNWAMLSVATRAKTEVACSKSSASTVIVTYLSVTVLLRPAARRALIRSLYSHRYSSRPSPRGESETALLSVSRSRWRLTTVNCTDWPASKELMNWAYCSIMPCWSSSGLAGNQCLPALT